MKIDINDPRITAFALGELTGSEAAEIARAMRTDSGIRAAVDEVRETASLLHETLGGGKVQLLTAAQRAAVRSAGEGPVITDIASAKVPLWKHPAVAGIGVAAVVALGIFLTNQQQGGGDAPEVVNGEPAWDWSQVDLENLTTPAVVSGHDGDSPESSAHAVAAAIREDTPSFREELKKRISEQDIKAPLSFPELEEQGWEVIAGKASAKLTVPLASGAASWPLLQRYLTEQGTLPPRQAVRIEEMVNHFSYKTPTMLKGGGLVADVELCNTPWNPATMLIAVHISAETEDGVHTPVSLTLNGERIQRVRLLGYAGIKVNKTSARHSTGPRHISKSHGNYVIYEIEPVTDVDESAGTSLGLLNLGVNPAHAMTLEVSSVSSWLNASADLRFASTVAATGMLLSSASSTGELDAARLKSLLEVLRTKDQDSIPEQRKAAIELLKKASDLLEKPFPSQG